VLHGIEDEAEATKMTIEVYEDAAINTFKNAAIVDCSVLIAKNKNLVPAKITAVNNRLKISCPSNGIYKVILSAPVFFKAGGNYQWSFLCRAKAAAGKQKLNSTVIYKIYSDIHAKGPVPQATRIIKNLELTNGKFTFMISVPEGNTVEKRMLDIEITNEEVETTGGTIEIEKIKAGTYVPDLPTYNLWPENLPPGQEKVTANEEYINGRGWYYDVSRPTLTVYKPTGSPHQKVGIMMCPGGSFGILDCQSIQSHITWLNSLGITVIELRYRVPTKPGIAIQDAQRALSMLHSKAKELEIEKIGVYGVSAGAHLALMAATNFKRRSYKPIDPVDDYDCRPDFVVALCSPYSLKNEGIAISDDLHVDDDTPSMFLAHGDTDPYSALNSAVIYMELRKRNIPSELHVWSKEGHGISFKKWSPMCEQWMKALGIIK